MGFGFFLFLSVFLLLDKSRIGVLCIAAALLHELGHLAALAAFRVRLLRICLCPLGIRIEREESFCLGAELWINLAGPVVNLLLVAASYLVGAKMFSAVNLALGLFELCPLPSLDGGQALFCLLQKLLPLHQAQRICAVVEAGICVLILGAGVWLVLWKRNLSLILLLAGLCLSLCPTKEKHQKRL